MTLRPLLSFRPFVRLALVAGLSGAFPALAADDPVSRLASAVCSLPDYSSIGSLVGGFVHDEAMEPTQVAEAFGVATFLGDLGRCANRQAIADSFNVFKKGRDANALDAAFARGRVAAKPESGATASAGSFQGSFVALGPRAIRRADNRNDVT